jgi:hypothetical protein
LYSPICAESFLQSTRVVFCRLYLISGTGGCLLKMHLSPAHNWSTFSLLRFLHTSELEWSSGQRRSLVFWDVRSNLLVCTELSILCLGGGGGGRASHLRTVSVVKVFRQQQIRLGATPTHQLANHFSLFQ